MGTDILYLSPCCKSEDFDFTYRKEGKDYYKCNVCNDIFNDRQLIEETIDYGRDEAER